MEPRRESRLYAPRSECRDRSRRSGSCQIAKALARKMCAFRVRAGRSFSRARFASRGESSWAHQRVDAALLHPPGSGGVRRRVAVLVLARPGHPSHGVGSSSATAWCWDVSAVRGACGPRLSTRGVGQRFTVHADRRAECRRRARDRTHLPIRIDLVRLGPTAAVELDCVVEGDGHAEPGGRARD